MALFDAAGGLIEFRSYEGAFTALSGDATGATSVDIGASQSSAAPGVSLQRTSSGSWQLSGRSFGACNPDTPTGGNAVLISGRTAVRRAAAGGFPGSALRAAGGWQQPDPARRASCGRRRRRPSRASSRTASSRRWPKARPYCAPPRTMAPRAPSRCPRASPSRAPRRSTTATRSSANRRTATPATTYIVRYPQYTASYNQNRGTPELGELQPRGDAFRRRGSLRLLHHGSGAAGVISATHHRGLHRRGRLPRLRHRSRPPGALLRPHLGQPRQRVHLSIRQHRSAGRGPEPGPVGHVRELPRRRGAPQQPRGLHRHRRGRKQGHAEERGQGGHPGLHLESGRDHAARPGAREHPRLSRSRGHRGQHAERTRRAKCRLGRRTSRRWTRSRH